MARGVRGLSRRQLISGTAVIGSTLALDAAARVDARTIAGEMPFTPGEANAPTPVESGGYQFFTSDEAAFVDAAVARLIPNDELGPGAKEAGVTVFIDRQLAGPFGKAETWYMQGPWGTGEATQGYQTRLTPAQLYRAAIKAIDEHLKQANGKIFAQISPDEQDKVLGDLDNDKIKLTNVSGKAFFELLLQNTIEGFFSDPIHGGNRDMAGWKLIGFPGARYDYRPYVDKHNQKLDLPPVSIQGRPGWNPKT
jgi:gluconate 2-dehydrogenase gamma chain